MTQMQDTSEIRTSVNGDLGAEARGRELLERLEELVPLLREQGPEIDRQGKPTREVIAALATTGVFKRSIPVEFGGLGPLDGLTRALAMYHMARGNVAVGWCVQNGDIALELAGPAMGSDVERVLNATEHVGPLSGGSI